MAQQGDGQVTVRCRPSNRYAMVLLWFYGAVVFYLIRTNFSVSIVCMTTDEPSNITTPENSSHSVTNATSEDLCPLVMSEDQQAGRFVWDRKLRGLLNSSFYFGYILTHIAGGFLAQKYGPKWVHLGGIAFATLMSFISPFSATVSPWCLFAVRMLLGIGCGVFVPTIRAILNNWSPIYEKSIIYTVQSSGYTVGSVAAFAMSGAICADIGWQYTFYVPSLLACVYLGLFALFGADGPEYSPCVSAAETKLIQQQRSHQLSINEKIPWRSIFTSVPCLFIFLSEFCSSWGGYTLIICGAQYMKDVLRFDIRSNGGFMAVPQMVKFVLSIAAGLVIDLIRKKRLMSTTNARKLAQSFGTLIPAAVMLGLGYIDCDARILAISLLCLGQGFDGFGRAGIAVNIMEVAPRYLAVVGGIMNTFSTASGLISPIVIGLLTHNGTQDEWQHVFYLGASMYGLGWLLFVIFVNAEEQPWAK